MNELKQTTIRLPPDLLKRLKYKAIENGVSLNRWILEAIKEKLNKEE